MANPDFRPAGCAGLSGFITPGFSRGLMLCPCFLCESVMGISVELNAPKEIDMLLTIAVILGVLWLLGMVSSYTMGGFIHLLLVLAIISILLNVIQGRRVMS